MLINHLNNLKSGLKSDTELDDTEYVASAYRLLFLPCCCLLCPMYLMSGPFNQPLVTAITTVPVIICWLYLIIYHLQLQNSAYIF